MHGAGTEGCHFLEDIYIYIFIYVRVLVDAESQKNRYYLFSAAGEANASDGI